eukprot:s550_g5.t2
MANLDRCFYTLIRESGAPQFRLKASEHHGICVPIPVHFMSVLSRLLLVASLAFTATGKRVVDVDRQKLQAEREDLGESINACEVSTECPVQWKTGAGINGFYCHETKGCRPVADGPFPDCWDQCYLGVDNDAPAPAPPAPTMEDAATTTEKMATTTDTWWDTRTKTTTDQMEVEPADEEAATTTVSEDVGGSTTTTTQASADPFAHLLLVTGGLMASPSNGCRLYGWHGEYKTYAGAPALTVDVYPMSTSVKFSEDFKDSPLAKMLEDPEPKPYERIRKVHEIKRKNSELAEKFCSSPGSGLAELCSFFSPGGPHLHCTQKAAKKAGEAAKKAGAAVKETAVTAVDATKDFVKEVLKDPLESSDGVAMWQPMASNGCTLTGWSGRYTIHGLEALKVDVSPTSTTFNFKLSPRTMEKGLAFLNGLNGTRSNQDVAAKFCSTAPLLTQFPNACAFWSPSSLNKLCPGLVAGHAVQAAKLTTTLVGEDPASRLWRNAAGGSSSYIRPQDEEIIPRSLRLRPSGIMAAVLVESMKELTLKEPEAVQEQTSLVRFKVSGLGSFELELDLTTAVRDVKKMATEACNIEPEHMRLIYNDRQLKDADTLELYNTEDSAPIQILFTAGHVAMVGGVGGTGGGPRGGHGAKQQRNPFSTPVRGLPGSKGLRSSRVSGRPGGMALIRKYGIMMKRQEFREKAQEIGFIKTGCECCLIETDTKKSETD